MAWTVVESRKIRRTVEKLPSATREAYELLLSDLKQDGPEQRSWPHYGPLAGTRKNEPPRHHCHLNKGRPRYVVIWRVNDFTMEILEVRYVGPHEGADYKNIR